MSDRGKKIFLALSIIIPFLVYCIYYYGIMIKNAPYRFKDMESVVLKYGIGDSLINQFDSKTGNYQYVNTRDSLVKTNVKLTKDDLLYLHHKAVELGFWDFPKQIIGNDTLASKKAPHFYLEFKYKEKSKTMLFDVSYNQKPKLREAAEQLIKLVQKTITDAADRGLVK
ncbi:hypothetical protein GS399_15695 [Pedobacter sp. HMF7647]|uniref:Uncharacterized protein n=1 Tax=Hufsiella arboris TaxID=2695275 RepID=A0A7K1YEF8_9SPHI|nr:hypothetical protein [Hufsiella arboris]MXV52418.1 hypothetical protein [Hufsiella arboris]